MFYILVQDSGFSNEVMELTKVFYPHFIFRIVDSLDHMSEEDWCLQCLYSDENSMITTWVKLYSGRMLACEKKSEERIQGEPVGLERRKQVKNAIKRCVYDMLSEYTGRQYKWGILTGIRPTKIVHQLFDKGFSDTDVKEILIDEYRISKEKAELLLNTAKTQRPLLINNYEKKISLYIHIPICRTKCLYCSFPSDTLEHCKAFIDDYLTALTHELNEVVAPLLLRGYTIQTLYIGGGTPTALHNSQLESLLKAVCQIVDVKDVDEFTVEGGRPDSLNEENMNIMKKYGVTRLSINPQTMNDDILKLIGRDHTVDQVLSCYYKAREIGFPVINMDVILGLPGESVRSVSRTMDFLSELNPENLTVHTLAIKRSSILKESLQQFKLPAGEEMMEMLEMSQNTVKKMGLIPYYLYRQKYMLGNLENVGYARPGTECIYNIQMMEEQQTIIAVGAGAVSKIYYKDQDRIERVPNVKNIAEYISRNQEMIGRKRKALNLS